VLTIVSALAAAGGILLYAFLADGPYRKAGTRFSLIAVQKAFGETGFRKAAFGYFGHMWELYAMWAFVPYFVVAYQRASPLPLSVPLFSFLVVGSGAAGCITGGNISRVVGSERIARFMLICSGLCCALSFIMFNSGPWMFIAFMLFWGFTVAGDSPQFSALVARHAKPEVRGSAITMITCIGFFISIVSIQLLNFIQDTIDAQYLFLLLIPGPLLGLIAMRKERS
jgi:MFS family permease